MSYDESEREEKNRNLVLIPDERIGTFLDALEAECERTSVRNFAARIGISEGTLRKYLRRQTSPNIETAVRIAEVLDASMAQMFGETNMYAGEERGLYDTDFIAVPRYKVEVSAGFGAHVEAEEKLPPLKFRREWIRAEGWQAGDLFLVTARGDSLQGLVDNGRPVMGNKAETSISGGAVYVARLDDDLIIKIMQRGPDGTIYLRSTNPEYREMEVKPDQQENFEVIGRAVWSDRRL